MKAASSRRYRVLYVAIAAVFAAATPRLRAAAITWDGGGTAFSNDQALWTDNANWNPNGLPVGSSDVTFATGFASGHTILVPGQFIINSLTINTTTGFSIVSNNPGNPSILLVLNNGDITRNELGGTEAAQSVLLPVILGANGNWTINGSNSLTVAQVGQVVGPDLSLTKNGSGTLVLGDPNTQLISTYNGGTQINDGAVRLAANGVAGTGPITVASGAILSFDGATITNHINLSGTGNTGNGALRSISSGSVTGTIRLDSNVSVAATDGSFLLINGAINDNASNFTLTKVGLGAVVLGAANTYGGNTTVSEGTLTLAHAGALGGGAAATVAAGATLAFDSGITITQNLLINGTGVGGNGALRNSGDDNTASGIILLQSNSNIGCDSGSLLVNGAIAGNFSLTKVGAGALILTTTNLYSGLTNLQEGTIRVRNSGALASGDVFVTAGAALELKETTAPATPLNINKTIHLNGSGISSGGALRNISSNNTWAGNVILESASTIGVDADSLTISGATIGAFNLTKVGPGTLILTSNANNHANTIVDGGILGLVNPNAFPLGRVITVHDGAMAEFQGSIQMARALNLNGVGVNSLGALHSPSGNTGWSSPITLQADSSIGVDAGELRISGAIGGSAALSKVGAGKLTLATANNYTGQTNINAGILSLETNNAIPASGNAIVSPGAALELRGDVSIPGAATLNGTGILAAGALRNAAGSNTWAGTVTLNSADANVGVDAGSQLTISGAIGDGAPNFPLTKVGAGTLVLTTANTYDGGTFINGGTLQISANNSLGAAGTTVTSNNGGKLIVAANTATSRTFNLNNGSLQVNSGATLQYNNATVNGGFLRGPGTHQINAGSSFNGVTALNGNSITQPQAATLVNFANAGTLTNSAPLTWDGGFNLGGGILNINSSLSAQSFQNDGVINISNGASLSSLQNNLPSTGGSRITINPGGSLNVSGFSIELNGALLVNNGTITGATDVNYGSLAKGAGVYGAVNVTDGGKFSPGNSPGRVTTGSTTWNSGGDYVVEIADGSRASGRDFWQINGGLKLRATPQHPFIISLASTDELNFDPTHDYTWPILDASDGISDLVPDELALDTSAFKSNLSGGRFSLISDQNDLSVHFTSVPEPSLALGILGILSLCLRTNRPSTKERI